MAIDQRKFTSALRMMSDEQLQQTAQLHQNDPYIFPLAFQESQERKALRSGMMAEDKGGGTPPPIKDQALMAMASQAAPDMGAQPLPESVGIGALPMQSNTYAGGGIVAFAGGGQGKDKVDPVQAFATQYRPLAEQVGAELDIDPGIIMAQWGHETGWGRGVPGKFNLGNIKGKGTAAYDTIEKSRDQYKNYESPEAFAQDYVSQMKRNWPEALGAKQDLGAFTTGLKRGRRGPYATDEAYAGKLGKRLTALLPIGAAQAATEPGAEAPSVYTGPGYTTEGLEALGQRLDVIREARSKARPPTLRERQADPEAAKRYKALQDLNLQSQREYEKYAGNIYNKPAFAAPSAGGKGVGTTTLPAAQAVAVEAAAPDIAAQEKRRALEPKPYVGELSSGAAASDKAGAASFEQAPADITPKEAIAAAKSTMTPEERKESGFSAEDWLTLGFALLSGKSPFALQNLGEAGAAMLAGKTARTKAGLEALKTNQDIAASKALARKYGAESDILEAGSKAENMLRTKAATLAASEMENWQRQNIGATPAEVDAQRKRLLDFYTNYLTAQGGTMTAGMATGVVVPQGVTVTRTG